LIISAAFARTVNAVRAFVADGQRRADRQEMAQILALRGVFASTILEPR
jgi:hypothetical protein